MRLPSRTLAALLVAGSLPLFAGSVAAAPINQSMGLKSADMSSVQEAQWRGRRGGHWRGGGRWIGPAAGGFAAGVIVGGALAQPRYYDDGYYAYGAAPGYVDPGYAYVERDYGPSSPNPSSSPRCTGDRETNSAFPSWMCR